MIHMQSLKALSMQDHLPAHVLKCGESPFEYTDKCKYLCLVLNEHLDNNVTVMYVAQSATRALGLLISKFEQTEGMPFEVYKK